MAEDQCQIYIRGFSRSVRQDDLRKAFKEFGQIVQCRIVAAYAFVTYQKPEQAKTAVEKMHDTEFNGQNLTVEIAGQRRKSKGPQADDICRRCRRKGHWQNSCPERRSRRRRSYSSSSSSESRDRRRSKRDRRRRRSPSSSRSSSSSKSSSSRSRDQRRRKSDKNRERRDKHRDNKDRKNNNQHENRENRENRQNRQLKKSEENDHDGRKQSLNSY